MKKFNLFLLFTFLFMTTLSVCLYAGSVSETQSVVDGFEITSGINADKDLEITFEKDRVISGKSKAGTEIKITLYDVVGKGKNVKLYQNKSYELVVGPSGIFSQNIDLSIGENCLIIEAKNANQTQSITKNIKCKRSEIKQELKESIVLPGKNMF